jgi:hypothetical protein
MSQNFEVPHDYIPNRGDMPDELAAGQGDRCLSCGEPQAHAYHAEVKDLAPREPSTSDWVGDSPFWLKCEKPEGGNVGIDIDKTGWVEENKALMRLPGTWHLMSKRNGKALFTVVLNEGDQFYYAKRHIGDLLRGKELIAYGIGKKKADGTPVNLWLMPNGAISGGDDVDALVASML